MMLAVSLSLRKFASKEWGTELLRRLHSRRLCADAADDSRRHRTWRFDADTFGRLVVEGGASLDVSIVPADQDNATQLRVDVSGPRGELIDAVLCEQQKDTVIVRHNTPTADATTATCHIKVPIKFDVKVSVAGSRTVSVEGLENNSTRLKLQSGVCLVKNLKSGHLRVHSCADVKCDSLYGNCEITTTGTGNVQVTRSISQEIELSTELGSISVDSLYAVTSHCTVQSGHITIGNCHGNTSLEIKKRGNCEIGTIDGNVTANVNEGNIDAHITQHHVSQLRTNKGDVTIGLSQHYRSFIQLQADHVNVDSNFDKSDLSETKDQQHIISGLLNATEIDTAEESPRLILESKMGCVSLVSKSWLESLKLSTLA